jgi:hypothetical protein
MGAAFSMYEEGKTCIQGFGGETEVKETTWKNQVDGRIILKWIFRKWEWNLLIRLRIGTGCGHL